ncbi:MAG TPA: AI-2E family transporter, partial [Pirellulales bacterium]|nr:AI-2E family transporter [Pirellulales bacterium]
MTAAADKRDHHWALFAAGVVVAVVGLLLWLAAGTLFLIFSGLLLAVFLSGLTDLVARSTRLRRGLALIAVCIALLAVLGLMGWSMASRVAEQAQQFSKQLPHAVKNVREQLQKYPWGSWVADELKEIRTSAEDGEKAISRAAGAASAAVDTVTGIVVIVSGTATANVKLA